MTDRLVVLANGRVMGEVQRDARGQLAFLYDAAWRQRERAYPLSLSMPLGVPQHGHHKIETWLWGLLPDNEDVLERWGQRFQASVRNAFSLLRGTGEDCPGAIQLVRPERMDRVQVPAGRQVAWLTTAEVAARLRRLRSDESAWRLDDDDGQFSLAGAQSKTALLLDDGRWGIPRGATPTTHILKPPIRRFPGHCENEHLCLQLARALGIPAARSWVGRFGREAAIVVERYDRIAIDGGFKRVHQEDFCQVLGVPPRRKYESEGGPGCRDIARAIQTHSRRPGVDLRLFSRAIAFNWVVGGTDAHAKNFSCLIGARGRATVAPLYDLASTLPYPGRYLPRRKLAMKIGGESRLGYIRVRHWERFAAEVGLPPEDVLEICESVATATPDRLADVVAAARSEGLDHPIIEKLKREITNHADVCLARLRR